MEEGMLLKLIGTIGCLVFLIGISIKEFQKIGILIGSILMFFYSLIVIKNDIFIFLFGAIAAISIVRAGKILWKSRGSKDLDLNGIRD